MTKKKASRRVKPKEWAAIYGYAQALKRFADTNDPAVFNGCLISHKDMAEALHEIALGADACEVFEQNGRSGRQGRGTEHFTLAYVYWSARVVDEAPNTKAVEAARNHFTNMPPLDAKTINRIARKYRDTCLDWLERSGHDLTNIRAQLAARSRRGKWE